jgi:poly-gamma-glutamate synthesis protein (capsule biosynthesis protein)
MKQIQPLAAMALTVAISSPSVVDAEEFTVSLTGDTIITRPVSIYSEPSFTALRDLLSQSDVAFTNIETLFHDFEGYPMSDSGGTHLRSDPKLAEDLAWLGFDIGSVANNHNRDYASPVPEKSIEQLRRTGIAVSGAGRNLIEARMPAYFETASRRVSLVSLTTTYPSHSVAGRSRGVIPPRPGVSALGHQSRRIMPAEQFERFRDAVSGFRSVRMDGDNLNFAGALYAPGDRYGLETRVDRRDARDILRFIADAATRSDVVLVSVHSHQPGGSIFEPADFFAEFARACIENGADMVVGHGPHVLRGIEIYKGKPIFYSLGNFIYQIDYLETIPVDRYEQVRLPLDSLPSAMVKRRREGGFEVPGYWSSVVARFHYEDRTPNRIELHPITLNENGPLAYRGRPMIADSSEARTTLELLRSLSAPFGTSIEIGEGVGTISLMGQADD